LTAARILVGRRVITHWQPKRGEAAPKIVIHEMEGHQDLVVHWLRNRSSRAYNSSHSVTTVPCRKPNRHEFVQVRPGEDWRLETGVFEDKINRDVYLVHRDLWAELAGEVCPVCLFLAVNRQGDVFLWPCKLPGSDGRSNSWNASALEAARLAETKWVRVAANMAGGMYDVFQAAGELSEPTWPELTFREVLKLCFKDRFIQSVDHPAIRSLRGEV
jgi:hypothetical protein